MQVAVVTGTGSGIGRATALRLLQEGYRVYATARKLEEVTALADAGAKTLTLDVTSEQSMQTAIDVVLRAEGKIDVLVNNAGYSQSGAVESVSLDKMRRQFETNVFGAMRLCQLVLPAMRQNGGGRIINLSSMGGKLVFPGGGVYHASKYALEALSDALRFEVRGFGVHVTLIEPGLIKSGFAQAALASMSPSEDGVYSEFNTAVATATREVYEKGALAKLGGSPEDVASAIVKALRSKRPRARYTVTASATVLLTQRALMPDGLWDAFLRSQFPEPKASESTTHERKAVA